MRGMPDLPLLLVEELVTTLRASTAVVTDRLGGNAYAIRQTRTFAPLMIPSVGIMQIGDAELEIEGIVLVQFDFFHRSLTENRALRNAVLRVVHTDYHRSIGSLEAYSLYQDGRRHDDPDANSTHMSTDIEYHPYRVTETA